MVGVTTCAFRKLRMRQRVFGKVRGNRFSIVTMNLSYIIMASISPSKASYTKHAGIGTTGGTSACLSISVCLNHVALLTVGSRRLLENSSPSGTGIWRVSTASGGSTAWDLDGGDEVSGKCKYG